MASTEMTRDPGAIPVQVPIGRKTKAFRSQQIDSAGSKLATYISDELYRYAPYLIRDEHARVPRRAVDIQENMELAFPETAESSALPGGYAHGANAWSLA
jgi:hypothetical protein